MILSILPWTIPGCLYNIYQIAKNKILTKENERAVVLTFNDPRIEWQNIILGVNGNQVGENNITKSYSNRLELFTKDVCSYMVAQG